MKKFIKESEIEKGISEGKRIGLNCFSPTSPFLKNLEIILRILLKYYKKDDLMPTIFGVVHELINFTHLNNMRYAFYKNTNLNTEEKDKDYFLKNEVDFLNSVSDYPKKFNYRDELLKKNMNILTVIEHNENAIKVLVYNQSKFHLNNESILREYLKKAMNYNNVEDYYNDHPEDPKGKGLGLAFSIILLKEAGLRPDLMRFGNQDSVMCSRIEIPFNSDYKSIRDRILNDESIVPFEKPNLIPPEFKEQFEKRKKELEKTLSK
ncbi:MAG: hypothetical protein KDK36_07505 [Leptospiraceae bacterium]|nr:hypothetical protein [Leptospiraceae bacterium]